MMLMMLTELLAADDAPIDPTTGRGPEWGKAAPVALLIIVLMGVALFLLIKSMNRHLRTVPKSFVQDPTGESTVSTADAAPTADRSDPPGGPLRSG